MGVERKYIKTCLGILDHPGGRSNIRNHALKAVDNNIGPIIQDMTYKVINKTVEDEVILTLHHDFWYGISLKKTKGDNSNGQ